MNAQRRREAANALAIAASSPGVLVSQAVEACVAGRHGSVVFRIAYSALIAACKDGNLVSSETRAEAEAMLRTGWSP